MLQSLTNLKNSGLAVLCAVFIFSGCVKDFPGEDCFTTVRALDATNVTAETATLNGEYELTTRKGVRILETGFYYRPDVLSRQQEPDWINVISGGLSTPFSSDLRGLEPETTYIYYAYVRTSDPNESVVTSGEARFTTAAIPQVTTVTTLPATDITLESSILNGSYFKARNDLVDQTGFLLWKTLTQTEEDGIQIEADDIRTPFRSLTAGLEPGTSYTFYAYVKLKGGDIIRGDNEIFTTLSIPAPTVVRTDPVTDITYKEATFNGAYTLAEGDAVAGSGFLYWETDSENEADAVDVPASAQGTPFAAPATGLKSETGYSVRAYILLQGQTEIIKGETVVFNTTTRTRVTTLDATDVNETAAVLHGNYTLGYNELIATQGFVFWKTSQPANTTDINNAQSSGAALFSATATFDEADIEYSYYAYVILAGETEMIIGDTLTLTPYSPTRVITLPATSVGSRNATMNGEFFLAGNKAILYVGFYLWKNDVYHDEYVVSPTPASDGTFSFILTNLDYDNYEFKALVRHTDGTEVQGESEYFDIMAPREKSVAPEIDYLGPGTTLVTGRGVAGAVVTVIFPDGSEQTTTVSNEGFWAVFTQYRLLNGDTVSAYQTEQGKDPSDWVDRIVRAS